MGLLFQHCQGLQRHDQDQRSGQRVLANCQQGAHTLVHGSRQVSAHEARGVHAKEVSSRSTSCPRRRATTCTSTAAPLVCPTSSTTSRVLPTAWLPTRRPWPS